MKCKEVANFAKRSAVLPHSCSFALYTHYFLFLIVNGIVNPMKMGFGM